MPSFAHDNEWDLHESYALLSLGDTLLTVLSWTVGKRQFLELITERAKVPLGKPQERNREFAVRRLVVSALWPKVRRKSTSDSP